MKDGLRPLKTATAIASFCYKGGEIMDIEVAVTYLDRVGLHTDPGTLLSASSMNLLSSAKRWFQNIVLYYNFD